ncbi:putative enzymatic polyprotein [Gregarina niphandrodes]|uniref:Enzymatic polyprotein n=1 Tax=Gregarina niphandrodes TaxID=110365 RepID=A0A023AV59_GRENI|nr:putative enzymatic polyprotein [Gregarina niphandrodes]EZG42664.1 putative enzymatic polyprotein [Gregarina niphandrodes]|eukprot:XP_011134743.1 putative enzymatic polyprotein [Gregarina niphandrodes]
MVADSYPLPRIWDHLRRAAGKKYYCTLDMNSGFWNVPIEEGSKPLTAFITPIGLFEFNVIPFGVKNSPAEFQRAMDACFEPLLGDDAFCYMDDIVICGDDFESVLAKVELFLQQCRKSGFYLRLDKSEWFKHQVKYLGHVVGTDGIKVQEKKTQTILPGHVWLPAAVHLSPSDTTAPLFDLLKKGAEFKWQPAHERAFEALKEAVQNTVTLHAPTPTGTYIIETDASELGVGALLKQRQGDAEVPLEFASRKFNPTERRWDTRERELFAVKWAVEKWRDYVSLAHFVVGTRPQ